MLAWKKFVLGALFKQIQNGWNDSQLATYLSHLKLKLEKKQKKKKKKVSMRVTWFEILVFLYLPDYQYYFALA